METATVPEQATPYEQDEERPEPPEARAEQSAAKLFQWSQWLHVGPDAEECDERFTGKCENEDHFHAWLRLPNQFQIRDIAEKAMAAKARRLRALKDPESDQHAVFELDLESVRDEDRRADAIDEILRKDADDAQRAQAELEEQEEFKHIEQDREEWLRLLTLEPEDRDDDELQRLAQHIDMFDKALEKRVAEIRRPKRELLEGMEWDELLDRLRKVRYENLGEFVYFDTYNYWSWFVGTLKPRGVHEDGTPLRPTERVFQRIEELKSASSEVIAVIDGNFLSMRGRMASGQTAKNS